ncbi:hypothetical protein [Zwartia sp.]|uniref:hypothetical protein n=1 Tax=Zwartia sp. TaxID=2978004 RepID=UPI002726F950|nr:hypothetical protein [Zwartia sp.]MDO9024691.1 hypothetical protein [Zwartia sp.]
MRKFFFFCLLGLTAVLLGACTPEYNWREWTVADERAVIMFPSRTQTEQRPIDVEGLPSKFSLTSSAVGPSVFSVGFIPLPEKLTEAQQTALVKKMVSALAARAGAQAPEAAFEGKVFSLETMVAGKPSLLMARVVVHRGMLIQVVVSGPKQSLSNENAVEFVRSLTLR